VIRTLHVGHDSGGLHAVAQLVGDEEVVDAPSEIPRARADRIPKGGRGNTPRPVFNEDSEGRRLPSE